MFIYASFLIIFLMFLINNYFFIITKKLIYEHQDFPSKVAFLFEGFLHSTEHEEFRYQIKNQ